MKTCWTIALLGCMLVGVRLATAQTPLAEPGQRAAEATVGNDVLQLRYLGNSPLDGVSSNLDFGALITNDREFVASSAWLFDTDLPVSRLRLQVGPRADLAWLATGTKTQVFALAIHAAARFVLIERLDLAIFGSGAYSPNVLTFGQAHNLYDFTAGGEIRLTGRLYALGGYRWYKYTLVNLPEEKLVNEVFAGVRWKFD